MKFGLSDEALTAIEKVLQHHIEIERAQLFGSRAMGNYRYNSDIDLVIWGKIDTKLLAAISAELDELPFPYQFDVQVYSAIAHDALREHIDRFGHDIYIRNN